MKKFSKILLSFLMTMGINYYCGQISNGGLPFTFQNNTPKTLISTHQITKPAASLINSQSNDKGVYKIGHVTPVNISSTSSGTWQTLANGDRIWRLKIYAEDALALALHYSCLYIPDGGELFLYNDLKNHVIGKFQSDRNFNNPITHTQMIQGETTWLEYYCPASVTEDPIIQIAKVVYVFRGVEDFIAPFIAEANDKDNQLNTKADPCQIDVACSPENVGWGEQIDAAVHYTIISGNSMGVCSASLLNNTSQDCTPYILSAHHCGENAAGTNLNGYTWYWNYQKSSCQPNSNGSNPSKGNQTMINGLVKSSSGSGTLNNPFPANQVAGSDYYLVELNSSIPTSYNAFYAGWNAGTSAATSGVSVHHPAGSAKKISTYTSPLSSATYNGGASAAHWRVYWSSTANGHGVTEGGSSGSPIFDQNGRVVGQLSGGSSYCTSTGSPDLYGKFSKNWTAGGSGATAQLQPWLDPGNTGVTVLDGAYEPCNQNNPPSCAINASTTTITAGGSVNFSDASTGSPNSWSWNFDNTSQGGVTPSTSSVQNPGSVTYSNPGTYSVELTVGNANGTCTTNLTITVTNPGSTSGCDTLINISAADTLRLYSTNNGGYISGWNGYGDLSKAEAYSNYSPYNSITGMELFLYGVNDGGNGATVDFNIWDDNGGTPGSIIASTQVSLANIQASTSGNGIYLVTFPSSVTINGGTIYCGITMNGFASYPGGQDSLGIVTNSVYDLTANSGWEQWSDGTWYDMNSAWGYDFSYYIRPILCGGCASGLVMNPATNNATCGNNNGQINITVSGGTPPYQYSIDGGTTYQSTSNFSGLAAGSYDVNILDGGGCTESSTISISNIGGVTASITSNQSICAGNSTTITAGGAGNNGTYSWDNGLGSGASHVVSPTSTTTYSVVVTDASGCTDNASVIVSVNTAPTISVSPATATICSGESITITASGAQSYTWNTGATTAFITVSPNNQTTYSVVGQNGSCAGNPMTATVSVSAAPTVSASANVTSISTGGTVSFSSAGSGATSYLWDFGDGNSSTQANPSHTYTTAGTYTVILTGTLNGCTNTSQVVISVGGVGINTINLADAIVVSPNPNNGNFEISIQLNEAQSLELELLNSIGQSIFSQKLNNIVATNLNYQLNEYPSGFYYLSVKSSLGSTTKRLLITE